MYYIYKITNIIRNKHYIGFTSNPKIRWANHKSCKDNRPLYNSMRKHGIENFTFEILYEHENKEHVLSEMEPFFIEKYNSYNKGYNCTRGGESISDYARELASKRMKLNNPMKILKTNNGSFKKGYKPVITPERNEKIKQSKLGSNNPNFNKKGNARRLNKYMICEHCNKITNLGNYKRWHSNNCKSNPYSTTIIFP